MKKYRMKGPDGTWWETVAASAAKARCNFRYRLVHECGMSWFAAREYDMSDLKMAD